MFLDRRYRLALASILVAGAFATVAQAADGAQRMRTRAALPATSGFHHSGGYVPLPPGDVLVGSISKTVSDVSSWNPFATVGYYDDGPRCVIRGIGPAFFFAPHFERVCRVVE